VATAAVEPREASVRFRRRGQARYAKIICGLDIRIPFADRFDGPSGDLAWSGAVSFLAQHIG